MGLRRWLRRWAIFERRWIPDSFERDAHQDTVRRRLPGAQAPASTDFSADDERSGREPPAEGPATTA